MVRQTTKPRVSSHELEYRKKLFPNVSTVKNKNVLCTSCNKSVKELVLRGKSKAHPFLETLLCERCFEFFGDGEFSVDEDGSDKYCRWCGQGGTLFLCSSCTAGFCKKCIKRNLPRSALNEIEDDNWKCFCCEVKPLYDLRALCWAAKQYEEEYLKNKGEGDAARKRKHKSSSESDEKEIEPKKMKSRSFKDHSPKQDDSIKEVQVAVKRFKDMTSDVTKVFEKAKEKNFEIKVKKLKNVTSMEHVLKMSEKIDNFLETVEISLCKIRENLKEYVTNWEKVVKDMREAKEQEAIDTYVNTPESNKSNTEGADNIEGINSPSSSSKDNLNNDEENKKNESVTSDDGKSKEESSTNNSKNEEENEKNESLTSEDGKTKEESFNEDSKNEENSD